MNTDKSGWEPVQQEATGGRTQAGEGEDHRGICGTRGKKLQPKTRGRPPVRGIKRLCALALKALRTGDNDLVHQARLHAAAAQVIEVIDALNLKALVRRVGASPAEYARLLVTLARLSEGGLKHERYRAEVADHKAQIQKELDRARKEPGLSPETIEKIERELNLF